MKTVIDAVNEFKGVLGRRFIFEVVTDKPFWPVGAMVADDRNGSPKDFREVCTRKEFNLCVESMSNNSGDKLYQRYVKSDKKLLEVENKVDYTSPEFWEDAPEGATHYDGFLFYKERLGFFEFLSNESGEWCKSGSSKSLLLHHMIAVRQKASKNMIEAVYTQAMADNGELPRLV